MGAPRHPHWPSSLSWDRGGWREALRVCPKRRPPRCFSAYAKSPHKSIRKMANEGGRQFPEGEKQIASKQAERCRTLQAIKERLIEIRGILLHTAGAAVRRPRCSQRPALSGLPPAACTNPAHSRCAETRAWCQKTHRTPLCPLSPLLARPRLPLEVLLEVEIGSQPPPHPPGPGGAPASLAVGGPGLWGPGLSWVGAVTCNDLTLG